MKLHEETKSNIAKSTFLLLESKFNSANNNKYDYSKFIYKNNRTPSIIICKEHGEFNQSSSNHLKGKGCPKCGKISTKNKLKNNFPEIIEKCNVIHNNKYNYGKFIYENNRKKSIIICPEHGEFEQNIGNHLKGHKCNKCAVENRTITFENIIEKCNVIHNNKYNYSKFNYDNIMSKSVIICTEHGEFNQRMSSHLEGKGCPKCVNRGWTRERYINKLTYFYLIKIKSINGIIIDYNLYKPGLTLTSVENRYKNSNIEYEILLLEKFEKGEFAWDLEKKVLTDTIKYKDKNKIFNNFSGKTELRRELLSIISI